LLGGVLGGPYCKNSIYSCAVIGNCGSGLDSQLGDKSGNFILVSIVLKKGNWSIPSSLDVLSQVGFSDVLSQVGFSDVLLQVGFKPRGLQWRLRFLPIWSFSWPAHSCHP